MKTLLGFTFVLLLASSYGLNLAGIPVEFDADDEILSSVADDVAQKIVTEFTNYRKTGKKSPVLNQIALQFANSQLSKEWFRKDLFELEPRDGFLTCTFCRASAKVVVDMFRLEEGELNGPNNEHIAKEIMLEFCEMFSLQTEEVCSGLFDSNWATIFHILQNSEMDSRTFCSLFLNVNLCSVNNPSFDWSLDIDKNGPEDTGPKGDLPSKSDNDVHILHISDIHHDPLYEPGSLAECREPLCCQRHKDHIGEDTGKAAGYWGDYRDCDAPWHAIENAFEHIRKTHSKIHAIYQTGDVIDHMVWATSVEKNIEVISKINEALEKTFPGVRVYPSIGNHEPHPLNVFSPPDAPDHINTAWLYEHLYKDWSRWLPASTKDTILKGGYYTVYDEDLKVRIISINNNDCYTDNWWLFHKGDLAKPQLLWLHGVLLEAEKNQEKVHLLAHIPSGDGTCWSTWSREYNRIIARFRHTISAIFNGHSHKDELNVHYSDKGHAIGMSWNGGSLTTFSFKNPNYKLYTVDPKHFQVLDFETWIYNLTEANHHPDSPPNWFKEYVFSEEFTTDLSPKGMDELLDKMAEHPELLRKFWRYKMTSADPTVHNGCNKHCLMSTLCRMATTVNNQKDRCHELQAKLEASLDAETTTSSPTEATTTKKPDGDGATSIAAISLSALLAVSIFLRLIA